MTRFLKKLKTFFEKIGVDIKKTPNKKSVVLCSTLLFVSLCLTFVAGVFSKKTEFEVAGHQISEIVQSNTKDGKYSYMLVESLKQDNPLPRTDNEYRYWYNVFGESRNAFFGVTNGNKESEAYFLDFGNKERLSFIYADAFFNRKYKDNWIHEYYHIELLFQGDHSCDWNEDLSFCYLTESQAKKYLNIDNPTIEQYKSIIGKKILIRMDGVDYRWHIGNIILENNDVVDAIDCLFSDWVLAYNRFPKGFNKQFCYIFNKYTYQNLFKLEYVNRNFSNQDIYNMKYGKNNLKQDITDIDNWTINILQSDYNFWHMFVMIAILLLSAIIGFIGFYNFVVRKLVLRNISFIYVLISAFLPYLIFALLSRVFKLYFFFSYLGLLFYIFYLTIFAICMLTYKIKNKGNKK